MINACIFNNNKELVGCITPSVIKQFELEFNKLILINHGFSDMMTKFFFISKNNNTADFLNCLKFILKKYKNTLDKSAAREISKSYHNLVRYCCSNSVYEQVFEETITFFRDANIEYRGKGTQGVSENECAFDYLGITVGVKIKDESDLYNVWFDGEKRIQAVVYFKDKKYIIIEKNICQLILAIKACIEDCFFDNINDDQIDLELIVREILNIANNLMRGENK